MRLICITGVNYVVYEGRKVLAHLVNVENHGVTAAEIEEYRTATYPEPKK